MGRQRTINDQNFWSSPRLYTCTTEDKVALLHLLTCPMSNIVGAYAIVPRIAGAEIGVIEARQLKIGVGHIGGFEIGNRRDREA